MLRHNARACTGCANNPHEQPERQKARERIDTYGPLLDRAFRLHLLAEFGMLKREELTATDLVILREVHDGILATRMKAQAALIAQYVAQLFGGK